MTKPKRQAHARRVVGYVRISRAREDETSTITQEAAIRAYCTAMGWLLIDVIIEPGRSAFKSSRSSRPGFRKAMSLIEGGAADTFVVWKLDRCARNTLDLLKFVREELVKYKAEFVSVTESFDTSTPMGRAMMTIVAALAELESAQKSERALEWHEHRRDNRAPTVGRPPLGYVRGGKHGLTPDPKVAPLVNEAARRLVGGESMNSVVRWLNGMGVKISRPGLLGSLRMPALAGLVSTEPMTDEDGKRNVVDRGALVPAAWTPVIDRVTWNELQVMFAEPDRRLSATGNRLQHPLRPVLRCVCGERMTVQVDRRGKTPRGRYVCSGPRSGTGCFNGIGQAAVDEAVAREVLAHLNDKAWRALRSSGSVTGPDPAAIEQELTETWQMVLDGDLDKWEYAELKARRRGELAAAAAEHTVVLPDVDSLREAWGSFGVDEKALVFRRAIRSLVIAKPLKPGGGVTDLNRIKLKLID